ncbi:hypothetical protein BDB00DRAFT_805679 [Zychaea mexicana]|uniref:uncharacterized protein n=1 Tax=Zychaea mexicana TaxID=64656 RepID=UPI0022FDC219|nr:uncharacterized protein BDB00DRAFT_805679 [Zychaea mexicana]KAI9497251.1 hypothetical protein BDB00DRAFT_805679 [Zychaea mexicana]
MKDVGIKFVEIVPADTILEFMGQAKSPSTVNNVADDDDSQKEPDSIMLKGEALFTLTRPLKIRGMNVKFKGASQTNFRGSDMQAPLLPKLKQTLFGKTTLPAGEHVIPFLLEVPNIYPASLAIKRASVSYKVELSIAMGLQKKSITAEHPIEIRRHLLRCKEMAPLVETQIIEHTVPAKFHYEIDAPQIVSLEQGSIPFSIKYLCFASQKPVRNIRTQLKQIELYSSADGKMANPYRKIQNIADTLIMSGRSHKKYIKRTVPALLHSVDNSQEKSTWKRPLILRHKLQKLISPALESPLITICHELEITFQFEHQFENIKAVVPIVIASIPPQDKHPLLQLTNGMPNYHFEQDQSRLHDSFISVVIEEPVHVEEVDPIDDAESLQTGAQYSILGEPRLPVTSSSINLLKLSVDDQSQHLQNNQRRKQDSIGRSIRKFASANELSSLSRQSDDDDEDDDPMHLPLERPRTTTPIVQRRRAAQHRQPWLQPIDVDLANGLKKPMRRDQQQKQQKQQQQQQQHRRQQQENLTTVDLNLMRSKARLQQVQRNSRRTATAAVAASGSAAAAAAPSSTKDRAPSRMNSKNVTPEDSGSTGSDNTSQSSRFAPSQDSSTTDRSDDDSYTLKSRPPSFVLCAAPGLPAETALRPQNAVQASLVEEQFCPDEVLDRSSNNTMSPTIATIASSTLLSPRTSYALQRSRGSNNGIPLSTATMSGGYRASSTHTRESSTLDAHDEVLRRIACTQNRQKPEKLNFAALQPQPPPPMSPLPPLPPLPYQPPPSRPSTDTIRNNPQDTTTTTTTNITSKNNNTKKQHLEEDKQNPYVYLELPPLPTVTNNSPANHLSSTTTAAPSPSHHQHHRQQQQQQQQPPAATASVAPPPPTIPLPSAPPPVVPPARVANRPRPAHPQSSERMARRMTKLYVEDSDDEVLDPSPPVSAQGQPVVAESAPLLPRLSLGTTFGFSLNIEN